MGWAPARATPRGGRTPATAAGHHPPRRRARHGRRIATAAV